MADLFPYELSQAQIATSSEYTDLDPRLQWLIACHRAGQKRAATLSTAFNEIAVIARVRDAQAWEDLSEVRMPTVVGTVAGAGTSNAGVIVTGRIPISRIEHVRSQEFVESLKATQELHPMLDATLIETAAQPQFLPPGHQGNGGEGAVVAVIDYGADFAHNNLRHADGTTRFIGFWNQNAQPLPGSPFGYGREYLPAAINLALQSPNPYATLGYDPADYEDASDPGSHGTHVMDIAAGNGHGTQLPGVAPRAGLIFVNISHDGDPSGSDSVGKSFGDSVRLLEAAKYIFDKAGDRPCVINISLGTNGGPHDGTTLVDQGLDSLVAANPNRAIVLAAGNAFADGIHATGRVTSAGSTDLKWEIHTPTRSDIEMEVWYKKNNRMSVELLDPGGVVRASVPPGQNKTLQIDGRVVFLANRLNDPNNGDNMIGVFLARGIRAGTYTLRLRGDTIDDGQFHAWIERDNSMSSRFAPPHDNSSTLGSISCGRSCLSVGSYDAHKAARPLSYFSSSGPTRDGRHKPEVSAPGHSVRAAQSSTRTGSRLMSGTSMAAPAVAGIIALMHAEARARSIDLAIEDVRRILIETARRAPPAGTAWNPRYGNGRVHAKAAVAAVMAMVPPQPVITAKVTSTGKKAASPARAKPRPRTSPKTKRA